MEDLSKLMERAGKELGYDHLKPEQGLIIASFLKGDVFGILPTGLGKSLFYTCLPKIYDRISTAPAFLSVIVIITPLTAIIKDQVRF